MKVYITKVSKFLPNDPVDNDEMESYLGMVDGNPSRARKIVLGRNGIKQRYYALDKEGYVTHTNTEMAANAIIALFDDNFTVDDIDLLSCGTASPEYLIPSHGIMVHGELGGNRNIEVVSFAGSCCAGVDALKYACLAVHANSNINAVVSASERLSAWIKASCYKEEVEHLQQLERQPMLAFEKEFLRWMLSDGAYATLLQGSPNKTGLSLQVDWIEITSYANKIETCMYAGADKDDDGILKGWSLFQEHEWSRRSVFTLKQNTKLLSKFIVKLGADYLIQLSKKNNFSADEIDWFLPHLSSMYFKEIIMEELEKRDFVIPENKWFVNLPYIGNIASASAFAMIEELLYSNKLRKGQRILLMIPESARFSYCYCMLTVV